jgi:hypothetical protein
VLVAGSNGGYGGNFNLAEIYDLAMDTWTQTDSLTRGRAGHLASRLDDGRVLVAGSEWPGPSAQPYDPAIGTRCTTGGPNTWRGDGTMSLVPDGRVLVAGGTDNYVSGSSVELVTATAEFYDPATCVWQFTGSINVARKLHTATQLADGPILIAAGWLFFHFAAYLGSGQTPNL